MLVVVAIIGIMLAVVSPSIVAGLDAIRMTSATNSVAAFLNAAVNRAERRQIAVEVAISQKDSTLTMFSTEAGVPTELKLPDGILIDAVLPRTDEEADGVRRLILLPGASVPGIGIQLANRRGGRRIVRLDPMTGFPRTEYVSAE
jgi:type II secretory pathway pseudopilin PulG